MLDFKYPAASLWCIPQIIQQCVFLAVTQTRFPPGDEAVGSMHRHQDSRESAPEEVGRVVSFPKTPPMTLYLILNVNFFGVDSCDQSVRPFTGQIN